MACNYWLVSSSNHILSDPYFNSLDLLLTENADSFF